MRFKRRVPAHVAERVVDTRTTCDACGADVNDNAEGPDDEITVRALLGTHWPEGDSRDEIEVDACAKCFRERIVPALEAAGFRVREHRVDDDDRVWEPDAAAGRE